MVEPILEIERKWLLKELPDLSLAKSIVIKQGYLPLSFGSLRLRKEKANGSVKYYLQYKSGNNIERSEWGEELPRSVFESLWKNVGTNWLKKTRYRLRGDQGEILEFDCYSGRHKGLLIVECEFKDLQSAKVYHLPAWVKVKKEITYNSKYGNKSLAIKGLPS